MDIWDEKILEHFLDVKESKRFQKIVADIRKSLGLPPGGMSPNEVKKYLVKHETGGKLDAELLSRLNRGVNKLFNELNLEPYLREIVVWHIRFGENKLDSEFVPVTKDETVNCYVKFNGGDFLIGIRPGATENQVRNFLHKCWPNIKSFKEAFLEENFRKSPNIKNKPKRDRDRKIIELYDQRLITAAGLVNQKNAPAYFKNYGVEAPFVLGDFGTVLGIKMPDISAIKKIIERYQKLRQR